MNNFPGGNYGYCGAVFNGIPPENLLHALNNRRDADTNTRSSFYECQGIPRITEPWIISINVPSVTESELAFNKLYPKSLLHSYGTEYIY